MARGGGVLVVACAEHPTYRVTAPRYVWDALRATDGVWADAFAVQVKARRGAAAPTLVVGVGLGEVLTLTGRRGRGPPRTLAVRVARVEYAPSRRRCDAVVCPL